jgi:hypothetical protein
VLLPPLELLWNFCCRLERSDWAHKLMDLKIPLGLPLVLGAAPVAEPPTKLSRFLIELLGLFLACEPPFNVLGDRGPHHVDPKSDSLAPSAAMDPRFHVTDGDLLNMGTLTAEPSTRPSPLTLAAESL